MARITVAYGDGIGPEIMDATLRILEAAGADIQTDIIEVGEKVYLSGNTSGIAKKSWDIIRRNEVFLKAPITTPQGGGYKSLNVSIRKFLGLYANVRPCVSYHPYVTTKHPDMDVVIIRENEEDLYAGIEHQHTDEVVQCLKIISRPGCEKIVRYAFEYAKHNGRKKVTCCTKDNIMKQSDGLFHRVFDEIAAEYPEIKNDHFIVDIGAARLADTPEQFDVVVLPNLYGDILSDVVAQIAGSVGLAGSSNVGPTCSMFEAIHGSAPLIAGQDIANPSGLLHGALMMLHHLGQHDVAERILNAWLHTIEQGIHTADIYTEGKSARKVGTKEFAQAVIDNLGKTPSVLKPAARATGTIPVIATWTPRPPADKKLLGVDVFLHHNDRDPEAIAERIKSITIDGATLSMITNRGIKVWPEGFKETFCTDHWRCRFMAPEGAALSPRTPIALMSAVMDAGFDVIKSENLYSFDGKKAFSLGQGQ
ncbi:MAG: NADP-dependent isocitrate dehydrogenase [Candidatus Kapaibacterium sp.]